MFNSRRISCYISVYNEEFPNNVSTYLNNMDSYYNITTYGEMVYLSHLNTQLKSSLYNRVSMF